MKIWEVTHFKSVYDGPVSLGLFSSLEKAIGAIKTTWPWVTETDLEALKARGSVGGFHTPHGLIMRLKERFIDEISDEELS
jgi:hypothetical protein